MRLSNLCESEPALAFSVYPSCHNAFCGQAALRAEREKQVRPKALIGCANATYLTSEYGIIGAVAAADIYMSRDDV